MATVKLFSLNRMAKFKDQMGRDVYVVPGDLIAIYANTNAYTLLLTGSDEGVFLAKGTTLDDIENEINRALQATKYDMDAFTQRTAEDIKEQIRGIKAEFESKKNEEAFSQNDFYPDLDKDKKGYN